MSQAPGLSGTPVPGQVSSAARRASCASSSARPTSRTLRASAAITLADSILQTASIALCVADAVTVIDRSRRLVHRSLRFVLGSGVDHHLESAPEHALAVERHVLRVHHLRQSLVLHDLGHDAVAMRARLVHDVREHHRLAGFELDALRKRRALARLHVVGGALVVLEGAVLAPDFSGKPRQIAIGRQFSLGDRYHDCVDVIHLNLLEWLSKPTLPRLHTYVSSPGCRSSSA